MKCENCNAVFVRSPCPDCGWEVKKESSEQREEVMVKPSMLKGGSAVNPQKFQDEKEEEERLRKPSEMFKKEVTDEAEHLVKPSQLKAKNEASMKKTDKEISSETDNNEESLRKPSEMFKKEVNDETEHLVKPSQIGDTINTRKIERKIEKPKPVISGDHGEKLLRPSELSGTSGRNKISHRDKVMVSTVKSGLNSLDKKISHSEDTEFKSNVKDTLLEVISLLEKLIEE